MMGIPGLLLHGEIHSGDNLRIFVTGVCGWEVDTPPLHALPHYLCNSQTEETYLVI